MQTNYVDQSRGLIVAVFQGFMKPEGFRERCSNTLSLVKETRLTKILVDTRELKVMLQENQRWIEEVWFSEAKKAGVKYMAFLVPVDIFGRISVEMCNRRAVREGIIQIQYFEEELAARNWLVFQENGFI